MRNLQLWDITPKPLVPEHSSTLYAPRHLFEGILVTLQEVVEEYGMSTSYLHKHLSKGLSMEQVVNNYWWNTRGVKLYDKEHEGNEGGYSDYFVHESIPAYVERCIDNRGRYIFV